MKFKIFPNNVHLRRKSYKITFEGVIDGANQILPVMELTIKNSTKQSLPLKNRT